jgi:hypothetical protein
MKKALEYLAVIFGLLVVYFFAATIPISTDLLECIGQYESNAYSISKNSHVDNSKDDNYKEYLYVKKYIMGNGYGIGFSSSLATNNCEGKNSSITCGVDCVFSTEKNNAMCKDTWSMQWLDKDTGDYLYKSVIVSPKYDNRAEYKYSLKCKKIDKVIN